ncbi:response regulator transcription factor, partial [Streptomyces sp. NPDC049577]|uniref:helix-turn-helix transcriptional regulator n=1 Tax=Streptomyces sp. NPDC049577 TaxID=3155153 RepID=UPI0034139B17
IDAHLGATGGDGPHGPVGPVGAGAMGGPGGPAPLRGPGQDGPAAGDVVDGISLVAGVRTGHPGVRTVVLAERDDPRRAAAALQAGAGGWVAKDCSLSRLLAVIRGVLRDETHLPPALLTGVLRELTAARKHRTESERLVESLTPREREVLRCMVAGLGRKAVAERLFLSPHTVRTHMQNVLGKLGVHSTLAAVALARRAGVGPVDLAGDVVERGGQLA